MIHTKVIGERTKIYDPELSNIRADSIGSDCILHSHIWVGEGVVIGNNVKVQAFTFIPAGVTIEDNVFIGPHVVFTNDKRPRVEKDRGDMHWSPEKTLVKSGASIGANSTILPGVVIGQGAQIGAGSVVTKDIPDNVIAYGVPATVRERKL